MPDKPALDCRECRHYAAPTEDFARCWLSRRTTIIARWPMMKCGPKGKLFEPKLKGFANNE